MNNTVWTTKTLWILVVLLAVGALALGVNRLRGDPTSMETYSVPPEIAGEVRSALSAALSRGSVFEPLGRVTLMPNGRLVVTAPESVQRGVRRIIGDITQNKPVPTPTIRLDVWVVTATPGATATGMDIAEVEPALAMLRKSKGALAFALLERLSTTARSGEEASSVQGGNAQLSVSATLRKVDKNESVVAAKLRIAACPASGCGRGLNIANLEAQTEIRPGELLVVGQSSLDSAANAGGLSRQVYYIVRATL